LSPLEEYDAVTIDTSAIVSGNARSLISGILAYYIVNSGFRGVLLVGASERLYSSPRSVQTLRFRDGLTLMFICESPTQLYREIVETADLVLGSIKYLPIFVRGVRAVDELSRYFILRHNCIIYFNRAEVCVETRAEEEVVAEELPAAEEVIEENRELATSILRILKEHGGMGIRGLYALNPGYSQSLVYRVVRALVSCGYARVKRVGVENILSITVKGLLFLKEAGGDAG
jgi:predicted transcriptional regulator